MAEKKSWFKRLVEQYNALCKDLGVESGACRGCVPIVKFDPERADKASKSNDVTAQACNTKNNN